MKGVQCYDLFGGIALKYHAFYMGTSQKATNVSGEKNTEDQYVFVSGNYRQEASATT